MIVHASLSSLIESISFSMSHQQFIKYYSRLNIKYHRRLNIPDLYASTVQ